MATDLTKEIRLLTLKQPFASLLFAGKDIETRSRSTKYRGLALISASKKSYTDEELEHVCTFEQLEYIRKWKIGDGAGHEKLCGQAIGVVEITGCDEMEECDELKAMVEYNTNLYSWHLYYQKLIIPFPITGSVTFGSISTDVRSKIILLQSEIQFNPQP